jgi:hypothetical protein
MSGALPLGVLYAFIAWKGKILTFIPVHKFGRKRKDQIFLLLFIQISWYMTRSRVVNIYSCFEEISCLNPHGSVAQCYLTQPLL